MSNRPDVLQRGDAVGRAGHLEVHVAQMIFIAQDVGQHRETVVFLDEAHGDTGHVSLHRHAGVHHREAAAAHRGHRRRAVRFGDLRHHADGVREFFLRRQYGDERALGEAAVADFAALGRAHAAHFTGGERRHVVVEQEAVFVLAGQRVDALRIALGAERGHHQALRLAASEQRRAVGARQHRIADLDGAHGARVAAVDARLAREDLAANDPGFDREQQVVDLAGVEGLAAFLQRAHHAGVGFAQGLRAGLLAADLVDRAQLLFGQALDLGDEGFVFGRRLPVPHRLAGVAHEFMDRIDRNAGLLVAVHHAAQHDLFAELQRFGFDHQHGGFGAGHDEVHLRILAGRLARVQHVLAIDVAHARSTDRAAERNAGNRQRGAHADHGGDVGVDFGVERQRVDDHVHFVQEAFGEQRADRPVDQAAGQRLVLAGLGFALEEAAGDLARGIGLLDVVDGQREEVLAGLGRLGGDHGRKDHGAVDVDHHGATGLAGDLARFHDDGLVAPLEGLGDFVEEAHVCSYFDGGRPAEAAGSAGEEASQNTMPFQRSSRENFSGMTQLRSV
jgi:hypothetical protein